MTNYMQVLAWLVEYYFGSLVPALCTMWKPYSTIGSNPNKAIEVITWRAHHIVSWFHVYVTHILLLYDFRILSVIMDHLCLAILRSLLHFFIPWYQQFVTIHHMPKYMIYNKVIVLITLMITLWCSNIISTDLPKTTIN